MKLLTFTLKIIFVILGIALGVACILAAAFYFNAQNWLSDHGIKDFDFELSHYSETELNFTFLRAEIVDDFYAIQSKLENTEIDFQLSPFAIDSVKIKDISVVANYSKSDTNASQALDFNFDSIFPFNSLRAESINLQYNEVPKLHFATQIAKEGSGLKGNIQDLTIENFSQPISVDFSIEDRFDPTGVADLTVHLNNNKWGSGKARYDLRGPKVELKFEIPKQELSTITSMSGRKLPKGISLSSGKLGASGTLVYDSKTPLSVETTIDATAISFTYNEIAVNQLSTKFLASYKESVKLKNQPEIKISSIDFGLPLTDISSNLNARSIKGKQEFELLSSKALLLGGFVFVPRVQVTGPSALSDFQIIGNNISLRQIASLYKRKDLQITGELNFSAPILQSSRGEYSCKDGEFWGSSRGTIAVDASSLRENLGPQHPLYETAGILSDFRYSELKGRFEYKKDGTLILTATIKGANPSYQNGREVHLNLTLEENIPKLLASIRLKDSIGQSISNSIIGPSKK